MQIDNPTADEAQSMNNQEEFELEPSPSRKRARDEESNAELAQEFGLFAASKRPRTDAIDEEEIKPTSNRRLE